MSLKLIKHSVRVANVCADIVGDICGVLSGAISAMISAKLAEMFGVSGNLEFIISACVAALTVGGKAIGKEIANNNSTAIVYGFGKILSKISNENK